MVVIGLGKNLLLKSVLGRCATLCIYVIEKNLEESDKMVICLHVIQKIQWITLSNVDFLLKILIDLGPTIKEIS